MSMSKIFEQEILQWCKEYDGPKFMALLCDPPYHLSGGFMGKKWDKDGPDAIAFKPETWAALAEHLLPGAFGMAFASSRGWHRLACAIEDAGLIIHPSIFGWSFGCGFPKATRIDSKIEPRGKIHRTRIDNKSCGHNGGTLNSGVDVSFKYDDPVTPLARAWAGHRYGLQAMKPALEPIIVFQKPYEGKPLASITKHGAGALNIDGARIGISKNDSNWRENPSSGVKSYLNPNGYRPEQNLSSQGRWPANFVLEHHIECKQIGMKSVPSKNGTRGSFKNSTLAQQGAEYMLRETGQGIGYADANGNETIADWECVPECAVRRLGEQSGCLKSGILDFEIHKENGDNKFFNGLGNSRNGNFGGDSGTAARFFFNSDWNAEVEERLLEADPVRYQAKASRSERDAGLDGFKLKNNLEREGRRNQLNSKHRTDDRTEGGYENKHVLIRNPHPTVKPIKLTEWLAKLLLPPNMYAPRRILIPFSGSGSEMIGAHKAGWEEIVGIEMEAEYVKIAEARIAHHCSKEKKPQKELELA